MSGFEVMARECDQCLVSRNRIVRGARAAQIIQECRAGNKHFICHKSPPGREIACRGVHEMQIGQMSRIAERLGMVVDIDPETLEPVAPSSLTPALQGDAEGGVNERQRLTSKRTPPHDH